MNPNYFRQDHNIRQSGMGGFDHTLSQTDRPTTPVYLLQQSNEEQYQKALAENLTGYFVSPHQQGENELTSSLLPKDVNYYYIESAKVMTKVDTVFDRERQGIESHFDEFLKQIVLICEEKKNEMFDILANDQSNFGNFYERFKNEVRNFLQDSQSKLDKNMGSFNSMVNNVRDDYMNPLEFHIHKLKLQRRQMDHVEASIQEIHANYNRSPIPEQKKIIERLVIDQKDEVSNVPAARRTPIDQDILGKNLKGLVDLLAMKMKTIYNVEPEQKSRYEPLPPQRMMSPKVWDKGHFSQLGRDLEQRKQSAPYGSINSSPVINVGMQGVGNSPNSRPSSHEQKPKNFLNLNLESSQIKKEKKFVQFDLPTIDEEGKAPEINPMKSSNININIHNRPYNHNNYINIYQNQQNQMQQNLINSRNEASSKLLMQREKSYDPSPIQSASNTQTSFRPSSVTLKSSGFYGMSQPALPRPNSSINDLDNKSQQPVLSVSKTNLLSKDNEMSRRYRTNLLVNDHGSKINCFEIEPRKNLIFYGTNDGNLNCCRISFDNMGLGESKTMSVEGSILFIHQIRSNLILVATDAVGQNLFTVDIDTFKLQTQFKTYKEKIKLVAYFDSMTFIIVTSDDKLLMYESDTPTPKKSFKIPTARLVDVCMPSSKLLFTGAENGDIRIIKINQESGALAIEVI
jgi:hypothetical protein